MHPEGYRADDWYLASTTASKEAVWAAQLEAYPESIEISGKDMLAWVLRAPKELKPRMIEALAITVGDPVGCFYRTSDREDAFVGWRFGTWCSHYMSAWPRWNYIGF